MPRNISFTPIKGKLFQPQNNLFDYVKASLKEHNLQEKQLLAISTKIVSLSENRLKEKDSIQKHHLIKKESDKILFTNSYGYFITITQKHLIPTAGIDESNSPNQKYYILYPKNPLKTLEKLHQQLCSHYNLKELGLLMVDSKSTPLRRGTTGFCLSHFGLFGLDNHIGKTDLFGQTVKSSQTNIVDSLASSAVLSMGESNEQTPLCLINYDGPLSFNKGDSKECIVEAQDDLFHKFFE